MTGDLELPPLPTPAIDELNAPFWDAVQAGGLAFQRCGDCGNAWLPAREQCPNCLGGKSAWETASGDASLVSWVVYHMAYHPAFADRLPYAVAIVELAEGPRMISNITGTDDFEALRIDQPLKLRVEDVQGTKVPRFVPV